MYNCALNCKFSESRGAAGYQSMSGTWKRLTFFLLLPMPAMPVFSFCSVSFSSLLRGLAPSVVFPFVYHQHLPLFLGSLDSGWPGTTAVYSYFPSVLINIIHPHSQNCLVWVTNYLVLLFISDLDLQPCKYSNAPILKICNRHTLSKSNALSHISLSFPSQSYLLKLLLRSAFSVSFLIIVLSTSGLQPFWHQELALWKAFFS